MVEEYWQEFGTESSIFPVLAAGWVPFALATQSSGAGPDDSPVTSTPVSSFTPSWRAALT